MSTDGSSTPPRSCSCTADPPPCASLVDRTLAAAPDHEFADRADQRHRVWAIRERGDLDALNAALAGSRALIADGHHRYAAYLRMQQQAPGGPTDRGLAMLVDQADTPLFLGAIHRVLLGQPRSTSCGAPARRARRFAPVAASGRVRRARARTPSSPPTAELGDHHAGRCRADRAAVEVLHDDLLPALGLTARRRRATTTRSTRRSAGSAPPRGVAVLMPAPDFDLVVRVAQAGRLLPEKATSFQPKPSIGVLIRSLRDE